MKKVLLILFVLFFLGNASAWQASWFPQNFHFNQPIVAGENFTLQMERMYLTSGVIAYEWGKFKDDPLWGIYDRCEGDHSTRQDSNMFKPPAACNLIEYIPEYEYVISGGVKSIHKATITLNCSIPGNYSIEARYEQCSSGSEGTQNFTFTVLPAINMPPFYDLNMFYSIPGIEKPHYIHSWDIDEGLNGAYYVKEFEVKVNPDCQIIGGGAKDLLKQNEVGNWQKTNCGPNCEKFELMSLKTKFFQQGVDGYTDCEDTYIDKDTPDGHYEEEPEIITQNYYNDPEDIRGLIKFKNLGIPEDSVIDSAELDLYIKEISDIEADQEAPEIIIWHMFREEWNESEATWNKANSTTNWQNPGASGPLDSKFVDSLDLTNAEDYLDLTLPGYLSQQARVLDLTDSLQQQINNPIEYAGWLISAGWRESLKIYSSNTSITEKRPKLKVTYTEPSYTPISIEDADDLHLYVDIKCDGLGYKDLNVTITDAENHSSYINTAILDINAFERIGNNFLPDKGPPGVNAGGPYYTGETVLITGNAFGVKDETTDLNYFITSTNWWVCSNQDWENNSCFTAGAPARSDCSFENRPTGIDNEWIYTGTSEKPTFFQRILNEEYIVCNSPGKRKVMFYANAEKQYPGVSVPMPNQFAHVFDVIVANVWADLKPPYFAIVDENSSISAISVDEDEDLDIIEGKWISYNDCGIKEIPTDVLRDQSFYFLPADSDGRDINTTAIVKCNSTGKRRLNLVTQINVEDFGQPAVYGSINGRIELIVIKPDSIRLDDFQVIPAKVPRTQNIEFKAIATNKVEGTDLNVEVEFEVFDKETGVSIGIFSDTQNILSQKQAEFSYTYDETSSLKENSSYRVTAKAFLLSGQGQVKDRDAVNDVLENHFWVLPAEDKLENLPETNFIGIIILLLSVVLILSRNKK